MPRISRQRACSRSKRVRASAGNPFNIVASETAGIAGASRGSLTRCACVLASIAARNRGTEINPVRYASSPAATSGSSTGASGVSAAAAVPPRKNRRFHRNRNASLRYSFVPALTGGTFDGGGSGGLIIASPVRGRQVVDDVADLENVLHELRLALHFLGRPVGTGDFHLAQNRARR